MGFDEIVRRVVASVPRERRALVAIDGIGGSGKTTFADEVAARVTDRPVLVLHADDFFQPPTVRHARGRYSPEGFWLDAYNYGALVDRALVPLSAAGDGLYRPASFDPVADRTVETSVLRAPHDALVLVEGTFLHRDELVQFWDYSILLHVPFGEAARRMVVRGAVSADHLARYEGAQHLYLRNADPRDRATLVVDNSSPVDPSIVGKGAS